MKMNSLIIFYFLLQISLIFSQSGTPEEKKEDKKQEKEEIKLMSDKEFFKIMSTGELVKAGSPTHLKMHELAQKAMKITFFINTKQNSKLELRRWMNVLTNSELDEGFGLFPPFYTDCGKNIHIGKNVFINSGCHFQDQAGIYIGDGTLIGHNVILATLNHNPDPNNRADMYPKPIHIGKNVWIGSGAIVLPGVTIGDNSIVGAGSVVTKNVEPNSVVAGNPAKFIKSINEN